MQLVTFFVVLLEAEESHDFLKAYPCFLKFTQDQLAGFGVMCKVAQGHSSLVSYITVLLGHFGPKASHQ